MEGGNTTKWGEVSLYRSIMEKQASLPSIAFRCRGPWTSSITSADMRGDPTGLLLKNHQYLGSRAAQTNSNLTLHNFCTLRLQSLGYLNQSYMTSKLNKTFGSSIRAAHWSKCSTHKQALDSCGMHAPLHVALSWTEGDTEQRAGLHMGRQCMHEFWIEEMLPREHSP